jgi:hypothetical protein
VIDQPGVHLVRLGTGDGSSATVTVSLGGDVNQDGNINAFDAANFSGSAARRSLLDLGFGFTANRAPAITATTSNTFANFPVAINLAALASDADLDPLTFLVTSVTGGTVRITDGTALFTPTAGFLGAGGFTLVAADGTALSAPATIAVNVGVANVAG